MNKELQEREIQNQMNTLLIFLVQSAERREFQNNFSSSIPYHIQPCIFQKLAKSLEKVENTHACIVIGSTLVLFAVCPQFVYVERLMVLCQVR